MIAWCRHLIPKVITAKCKNSYSITFKFLLKTFTEFVAKMNRT